MGCRRVIGSKPPVLETRRYCGTGLNACLGTVSVDYCFVIVINCCVTIPIATAASRFTRGRKRKRWRKQELSTGLQGRIDLVCCRMKPCRCLARVRLMPETPRQVLQAFSVRYCTTDFCKYYTKVVFFLLMITNECQSFLLPDQRPLKASSSVC